MRLFKGKIQAGTEFVKEGTKLIDEIFTSKEEKLEAKKDLFKKVIDDRQGARNLYQFNSSIQKIFSLFFLIIWAYLLYIMLSYFIFNSLDLKEWQIAFINTIWGGVSMKLGTIIDFFFGGSDKK